MSITPKFDITKVSRVVAVWWCHVSVKFAALQLSFFQKKNTHSDALYNFETVSTELVTLWTTQNSHTSLHITHVNGTLLCSLRLAGRAVERSHYCSVVTHHRWIADMILLAFISLPIYFSLTDKVHQWVWYKHILEISRGYKKDTKPIDCGLILQDTVFGRVEPNIRLVLKLFKVTFVISFDFEWRKPVKLLRRQK